MGQSFNLSQVATKVNSSGQYDVTNVATTYGINQGGTNNISLPLTAGGILYTDGSAIQMTNAGTSNQVLITTGSSSAPIWANAPSTAMNFLGSTSILGSNPTVSPVSLSGYKFVLVEIKSAGTYMAISSFSIGGASVNFSSSTLGAFHGSVLLDLTYGTCGGLGIGSPATPGLVPAIGSHGYTTASMSIGLSVMMTSFAPGGTMYVWGVY